MPLLSSLHRLITTSGLLRLLALLLSLLSCGFLCLLLLCLASLFTSELLSPLLLLFGLDLAEKIAGSADLVANRQRTRFPNVRNNKEVGIELREDRGSSVRPVAQLAMCVIGSISQHRVAMYRGPRATLNDRRQHIYMGKRIGADNTSLEAA